MFPNVFLGTSSSPARDVAPQGTQGAANPGTPPMASSVVNVVASASAGPPIHNGSPVHGYKPEETGASADVQQQVRYNRRLRAAFAYGEVMCLLGNSQVAMLDHVLLGMIAKSLKQAVRFGVIPPVLVLTQLHDLWEKCDPAGPLFAGLSAAVAVVSDNENASLDSLSDNRVHAAHVVGAAVCAAYRSNDPDDEFPGSAEVIDELAKCVTLNEAKHYFDQTMDALQLPGEFRRRIGIVRFYLEGCLSRPGPPSRCPVEFPPTAGREQIQDRREPKLSEWFRCLLDYEAFGAIG